MQLEPSVQEAWEAIGGQLRAARERKGLTLADVSARTKIKASFLAALERGDIAALPTGPFVRGFARAYAIEVGLDPRVLLQRVTPEAIVSPPVEEDHEPKAWPEVAWSRGTSPVAVAALILTLLLLLPRWNDDAQQGGSPAVGTTGVATSSPPRDAAGSGPPTPVATGGPDSTGSTPAPGGAPAGGPPPAPVTFDLHATSVVWVEATADGRRVAYELLGPGARRTFRAERALDLRIGDAAAIEYTINGVRGLPLGRRGEVRDLHVTPERVETLQSP